MVRNDPEQFDEMGFVFVRHPNSPESVERARQAVGNAHSEEHEAINQWPPGDMFIGWDEENIRNWPGRFFEFWMPRKRLSVIAREVAHLDLDAQAVFSRRAWRAIKAHLAHLVLPTAATIGVSDAELAAKILGDNDHAARFQRPTPCDVRQERTESPETAFAAAGTKTGPPIAVKSSRRFTGNLL
jgi:hypothetical protein